MSNVILFEETASPPPTRHRAARSAFGQLEVVTGQLEVRMLLALLVGVAAMWTLVAPTGELFYVADATALSNLCKEHSLHVPNMRHHVGLVKGNGTSIHVQGWQTIDKVQWL